MNTAPTVPTPPASQTPEPGEQTPLRLTPREVEVLGLIVEGRSSKEVADQLFVSKRTVDFHLANVYQKLGVSNRLQAFREATRRGLLPA